MNLFHCAQHQQILVCPCCRGELALVDQEVRCLSCRGIFPLDKGIPLLFVSNYGPPSNITEVVRAFYEENPFPNYDDLESKQSLMEKARRGVFARLLNEQIPPGARVLEVGCGTGQLTNF